MCKFGVPAASALIRLTCLPSMSYRSASYTLCVGDTVIAARRLMKGVVEVFTTRCDGGAAQQGHAVSGSDPSAVPISWWVDLAVRGRAWLVLAVNTCRL